MSNASTKKAAPATCTDTITAGDLRIASVSLLTRGQMPADLSGVLPSVPLTDADLAKRFLNDAADSIMAQPFLWQSRNVDTDLIAEKLRRVPAKAACDTYQRLLAISMGIWESLLTITVVALDPQSRRR